MPKLNESRALAVETVATPIANTTNTERKIFIISSVQKLLSLIKKRISLQIVDLNIHTHQAIRCLR
jgi:hypothetical protein